MVNFNMSELGESERLGVAGMRERAWLVGGVLRVQSAMENGAKTLFVGLTAQLINDRYPLH